MRRVHFVSRLALLGALALAGSAAASPDSNAGDCWLPAFKAGDAEAVTRCYATDSTFWVGGAPMASGSQAIHDTYAGYFDAYTIKEVALEEMGSEAMGDTAVHWGTYRLTMVSKADGTEHTETGRYTDVQKKVNGRWLYAVDHASADPVEDEADDGASEADAGT